MNRDVVGVGGYGVEGVGGWYLVCGLWGFGVDYLLGSGYCISLSNRLDWLFCVCVVV